MQLEKLELVNFKCFARQPLRFSKITVLLGANSSGKSSLLHGVLAAAQTDNFPLTLSANGDLVDLGGFRELVHRRRTGERVGIRLTLRDGEREGVTLAGTFKYSRKSGMPELSFAEISDASFAARITREKGYQAKWTYDEEPWHLEIEGVYGANRGDHEVRLFNCKKPDDAVSPPKGPNL